MTENMNQEPNQIKQNSDSGLKKIGLSVLCGLLFGLTAGLIIVALLAAFRQETDILINKPDTGLETEKKEETPKDGGQGQTTVDSGEKEDEEKPSGSDMSEINELNEDAEIEVADMPNTATTVVTDVTEVVDQVMPCVVSIFGTYIIDDDFWGYFYDYEAEGGGSGIIVGENDSELLIATNNHVVQDSEELTVQFIDDSVATASLKGTDPDMDLAVISINLEDLDASTKNKIRIATLGNSDLLKVGEPAIAIGNALGYGQSVTTGVISAVNRAYTDSEGPLYGEEHKKNSDSSVKHLIQTDAAINPGNSGGALLNVRGEVIGINSSKIASYSTEGMGYAIPISTAEPILENLMQKKTRPVNHKDNGAYLGISGMAVTGDLLKKYDIKKGIYITQVFDKTPAEDAGIRKGDILLDIDGYSVGTMDDLTQALSYYDEGDKVTVKMLKRTDQGYQSFETTVTLGGK